MANPQPAAAVNVDDLFIPLIDFSEYLSRSSPEPCAQSILSGFRNAGFIYLKNHGIPRSLIQTAFTQSATFFERPQSHKDHLEWRGPESNRGYSCMGREKVTNMADKSDVEALRNETPDLKESFEIGRDDEDKYPNPWPDAFDDEGKLFRREMNIFFEACKRLHMQVMRAVALGLGMEEGWFDSFTDGGDNTLRLLHYPSVNKSVFDANANQVRAGSHTDYGSITLLFQDDRGGLQVQTPKGTFVDATPIPDTIVINAGDLLARWTNDAIKSTVHRVVQPSSPPQEGDVYKARYSIAYFCNPNFERMIETINIRGTVSEERPGKYEAINSGEYLVRRLTATY